MRKILTFLFAALMSVGMWAVDPQGEDTWDDVTKTLTVNSNPEGYAYSYESDIENLVISDAVTSIGEAAFCECSGLTSVTFGNSVESIGDDAFYGCSGLTSITIPNSVTSIEDYAFQDCSGLTSVTFGNSVESIGQYAFNGCSALTSLTIPNSVTSIGESAFKGCTSLTSITCHAVTPPSLGGSVFGSIANKSNIPLYVPFGSVAAYQAAAQWNEFNIQAMITPNVDPQNAGVYYCTVYDSQVKYALPEGVEAYVATLSGSNLLLTKIAEAGQTIPADNAVILKSSVTPITLSIGEADAVTFSATNNLQGSDASIATPGNCYVLSCENNLVGFYHYTAANLNAHKAYVIYSGSNQAPRRMPFIFDAATGVENVQGDKVQSTKVLRDGQLIIIRNGVEYNANGMMVK